MTIIVREAIASLEKAGGLLFLNPISSFCSCWSLFHLLLVPNYAKLHGSRADKQLLQLHLQLLPVKYKQRRKGKTKIRWLCFRG